MTEIARVVANAASVAAEAARAAQATSSGERKKDLYRLIPRPPTFAPSDRDQEVSQWRDWYWAFKQYLLVVDGKYEDDIAYVERATEEVDWDLLDSDEQHRARFMYSLLSTLLQGRLLSLVRGIEKSNGMEALRQLLQNCQPRARNRTMAMLQSLMSYPAFNMKGSVMAQVVRMEEHFNQFEKMGGKLTDEMKAAVLLKCISGPLKIHLNLSLNESSSYAKIREVIQAYDTATTKWTDGAINSFLLQPLQDSTGVMPMEVDRVKGGKNSGKSKGKGKDVKGKSKGKEQKGKGKNQNHASWTSSSATSWTSSSKGNGKGDQKGQSDKTKGKGKTKESGLCFNCGRPGHQAKDCWRVRQVGNADPSATVVTNASVQESVGPSASQAGGGLAVKRVSVCPGDGEASESPVVFDLRSSSSSSWNYVRMVKFFYIDEELEEPVSLRSATVMDNKVEKYEVDGGEVSIIIDSGADAPVFPASMVHCGTDHHGQEVSLQDAQGRKIPVLGQRSVSVLLEDVNGIEIELRDNVIFSNEISQPILSYGRLMDAGWSICAETRCLRNGNFEVPLEFQNHSLVVKGHVRNVSAVPTTVRALKADLTPGLQAYVDHAFGWSKEGERWVGIHLSSKYQNPLFIPNLDYNIEWFRTTLIKKDQTWIMVEFCEKVSEMLDPELYIDETAGRTTVVTFLTDGFEDVENMGFQVEGGADREELELLEGEIQPYYDIPMDEELEQREVAEAQLQPGHREQAGDDQHGEPPLDAGGQDLHRGQLQPQVPQEGHIVVGEVIPAEIEVNGQVLSASSTLATLRAACGFYGVSKTGSKAKCYRRLCQHQKTLELLAATAAVAQAEGVVERHPNAQALAKVPDEHERELHALTHTPYAPWCSSCLKHRARPDQHRRTGEAHDTPVPVVSMDFAVTKKKDGLAENPEGAAEDKGALWLVLTDSHTGYLGVIPIQSKGQINYMTHEVLSFVQSLGYAEVGFYGDNEPTIRQILRTIITSRHALGLKPKGSSIEKNQ